MFRLSFYLFLTFFVFTATHANDFKSDIFSYDNLAEAKGCHVLLKGIAKHGLEWIARDINETDLPYVIKAFGNATITKSFGYGAPIPEEKIRKKFVDFWIKRFQDGHPHGALILLDAVTQERLGFYVAGEGDSLGASEIAGLVMEESWDESDQPKSWRQGITTSILNVLIKEWAPEVKRLGTDPIVPDQIRKAFQCFNDKPLTLLEATASPINLASWHVLTTFGFEASHVNLASETIVASYEGMLLESNQWEELLNSLFTSLGDNPLDKEKRHLIKGINGTIFALSQHPQFNVLKFHFERPV